MKSINPATEEPWAKVANVIMERQEAFADVLARLVVRHVSALAD